MIKNEIALLRVLASKLEPNRKAVPIANDLFEAAVDWQDLGKRLLADEAGLFNAVSRL